MWMMGCGGVHSLNKTADSISNHHTRRSSSVQPLISRVHQPRPHNLLLPPTFSSSIKATDNFFPLRNLSSSSSQSINADGIVQTRIEQSGSNECTGPAAAVSSRWNPTPEQLCALEDLYRSGIRTPTADQIQYITTQLRRFGKIEGKNVFYWFQNHKAREKQKHRRRSDQVALEFGPYREYHSRNVGSGVCAERNKSSGPGLRVEKSHEEDHKWVGWQRESCMKKHRQHNGRTIFTIEETVQEPSLQLLQNSQYVPTQSAAFTKPNLTTEENAANSSVSCRIPAGVESKQFVEEASVLEDNKSDEVRETLELFPLRSESSCNSMNITNHSEHHHKHHDFNAAASVNNMMEELAEQQACQGGYFFQFLPVKK